MCSRTAFTNPILPRNEMKTATPPNGVTARCVSRRINRSSDNRAEISRGTGLSVAFDSISLLSQIPGPNLTPNFGFPVKDGSCALGERQRVDEVLTLLFDLREIIEEIRHVRRILTVRALHELQRF